MDLSTVLLIYVVMCSAFVCAMIIFPTLLTMQQSFCREEYWLLWIHTSARVCMDMHACMYVCMYVINFEGLSAKRAYEPNNSY